MKKRHLVAALVLLVISVLIIGFVIETQRYPEETETALPVFLDV